MPDGNSPLALDRETERLMLVHGSTRRQRYSQVEIPEPWKPPAWGQYNERVQWLIQTAQMNDALANQQHMRQRERWRARDGARSLRALAREAIDDDE